MEKPIEIKRRAQRFVQSGDVDAALEEYEKLARAEPNEPYHAVVIADLLFKKGQGPESAKRYLAAVEGYERAGLYKNGIAVCKKLARLNLVQGLVFRRLADLHKLDGLLTEAALYYMQHAEWALRAGDPADAVETMRAAYDAVPENVAVLERIAEVHLANGENERCVQALAEAAARYDGQGLLADGQRVRTRLAHLDPENHPADAEEPEAARAPAEAAPARALDLEVAELAPRGALDDSFGAIDLDAVAEVDPRARFGLDGDLPFERTDATPAAAEAFTLHIPGVDDREPTLESTLLATPPAAGGAAAANGSGDAETLEIAEIGDPAERAWVIDLDEDAGAEPPAEAAPALAEAVAESADPVVLQLVPVAEPEPEPVVALEDATEAPAASSALDPEHPAQPGLAFDAPAAAPAAAAPEFADLFWSLMPDAMANPETMKLLQQAQEEFRNGQREQGVEHLLRTAAAHEGLGALEPAARIYRALHRVHTLTPSILILWFENSRRRGDSTEAASIASQMGERALGAGERAFAREWFERALALDPNDPRPQRRLQELAKDRGRPMTTVSGGARRAAPAAAEDTTATAETGDRIEITYGYGDVQVGLGELVSRFREGVQDQVSGDAESHYALGVSYLEMGLVDQAMESLRAAAERPELRARATELIGRCLMDHGRFEEAASEFRAALAHPQIARESALGVRFELGLALEAAGRLDEALAEFEQVYAAQPSYPDAALKIRVLRKALEE